jgi:hypothetical protein
MSRPRLTVSLVAALSALFALGATAAGSDPDEMERAGDVSRHRVDLRWKPDEQDIAGGPIILDTFDSFGSPFGEKRPLETRTPRSQIGTDQRSGTWTVYLTPGNNPGTCSGTFEVDRKVIETTATYQIVEFDGSARLRNCRGVRKFRNVEPGRLGKLTGRSECTAGGCGGGLRIRGRIRF